MHIENTLRNSGAASDLLGLKREALRKRVREMQSQFDAAETSEMISWKKLWQWSMIVQWTREELDCRGKTKQDGEL